LLRARRGSFLRISDPEGNAVKDFSSWFVELRQSSFSPGKGEKVADRPDEGLFDVSVDYESLTALPGRLTYPMPVA
jgi:hypothetical protein